MDSTIARVGSEALSVLKTDLTVLSKTLHDIYELMNADMRQVNVAWQDSKYQEFVDHYQPQIQKCDEIANRYAEWCARVLDPTIENVISVETTDVGIGEGSVGGGNSEAAVVGGMAATGVAGATVGVARTAGFNFGANQGTRPKSKMGNSSADDYKAKFKEKEVFYVDENGEVKTDRKKLNDAVNAVHGKNLEVEPIEMEKGYAGKYNRDSKKIFIDKGLSDKEYVETLAHERQHGAQHEFCNTRENRRDPMCENWNNYQKACVNPVKENKSPEQCQAEFDKYYKQDVEVNARAEETPAGIGYDEGLREFIRENKLEKPHRWKK